MLHLLLTSHPTPATAAAATTAAEAAAATTSVISTIATVVSALVAFAALIVALRQNAKVRRLQEKQAQDDTTRHTEFLDFKKEQQTANTRLQQDLAEISLRLTQRMLFVPVWSNICNLGAVPVDEDNLSETMNALQLVATCRRYEIIDQQLLDEAVQDRALKAMRAIVALASATWDGREMSGRDVLDSRPGLAALLTVYEAAKSAQSAVLPLMRR